METVYFNGAPCHTCGDAPAVGTLAPAFSLVSKDMAPVRSSSFEGKNVVLNIFPSLDTPVCAASVRRFNVEAAGLKDTVVICVSKDLPFAMARFCAANDIENVIAASAFRDGDFSEKYGLELVDGPLKGLLARAVIIINKDGFVEYRDISRDIASEPDYAAAIEALKRIG